MCSFKKAEEVIKHLAESYPISYEVTDKEIHVFVDGVEGECFFIWLIQGMYATGAMPWPLKDPQASYWWLNPQSTEALESLFLYLFSGRLQFCCYSRNGCLGGSSWKVFKSPDETFSARSLLSRIFRPKSERRIFRYKVPRTDGQNTKLPLSPGDWF